MLFLSISCLFISDQYCMHNTSMVCVYRLRTKLDRATSNIVPIWAGFQMESAAQISSNYVMGHLVFSARCCIASKSVVVGVISSAIICWGDSIRAKDLKKLHKQIKNANSVLWREILWRKSLWKLKKTGEWKRPSIPLTVENQSSRLLKIFLTYSLFMHYLQ